MADKQSSRCRRTYTMHDAIQTRLLPLLDALVSMLEGDGNTDAAAFYRVVHDDIESANDDTNLLDIISFRLGASEEVVAAYGIHGPSVDMLELVLRSSAEIASTISREALNEPRPADAAHRATPPSALDSL